MKFGTMVEHDKILVGIVSRKILPKVKVTVAKNRFYHPDSFADDNFWRNKARSMKFGTMVEHDKILVGIVSSENFAQGQGHCC